MVLLSVLLAIALAGCMSKAERDQWKALDDMHVSRINRLEAENERFRRGLETLATTFYKEDQHQDYARHVLGPARNALGGDNG